MARSSKPRFVLTPERRNEILGVVLSAASLLLFVSLISYQPDDLPFFTSNPSPEIRNLCGIVGAAIAGMVRSCLGLTGYLLVGVGFLWAAARFSAKPSQKFWIKFTSTILFCVAASALLSLVWDQAPEARVTRGGLVGHMVSARMVHYFGPWGAPVVLFTLALLSLLLVTELAVWPAVSAFGRALKGFAVGFGRSIPKVSGPEITVHRSPKKEIKIRATPEPPAPSIPKKVPAKEEPSIKLHVQSEFAPKVEKLKPVPVKEEQPPAPRAPQAAFQLPSLELLNRPIGSAGTIQGKDVLERNAGILEESLREFGIEVKVAAIEQGPVITRYEVEPAPGVKVQKITTLSDDLALILKAPSVRIIAPIPGKARIGIEVPNPSSSMVTLREVLESSAFQDSDSKLTLGLGKDIAGHPLVADLTGMPHLLIAGTTGSGKTVCMNALITSILFNATPEEVRFLMVDPKMVELSAFNGIPHLILPVLTNPKQVPLALGWVVQEMETRYKLFAKLGVRNIEIYHEKQAQGQLPKEEIPDNLPYLIVIIDELADLMLVAQAEVEKTIARLAHLSRAVGIHMILATQRPSVDVLTGVIKANFPARISFQVASKVDSRTVLDTMGADKLLGKGDLLFLQPGSSKLIRAQGTLMTDEEISRVVEFLKAQREPSYETAILEESAKTSEAAMMAKDVLYDDAVRVVVETGQASVSLLQRRMRLGYGRAARILDRMEEEGIVGPIRGAKPREVYLKEVPDESLHR